MLKNERQQLIVGLCDETGAVSVHDVAERLGVSEMTVRRDLDDLARAGRIVRVHGGARKPADPASPMVGRELAHGEKRSLHVAEKVEAAGLALAMVEPATTIFLGPGTTVEELARRLPDVALRVVTNSISAFSMLKGRPSLDLILVGGDYRASTDAVVGPLAEAMVASLGFDMAFVGCNGVGPDGVSTSNAEEGRLQHEVLGRSASKVVLCDPSKLGRRDYYMFFGAEELDAVICPGPADPTALARLGECCKVIR